MLLFWCLDELAHAVVRENGEGIVQQVLPPFFNGGGDLEHVPEQPPVPEHAPEPPPVLEHVPETEDQLSPTDSSECWVITF